METGENGNPSQIAQKHAALDRKKENENVTTLLQKEMDNIVLDLRMNLRNVILNPVPVSFPDIIF